MTPKIKSLWERTPKLGFGSSPKLGGQGNFSRLPANGLPANPAPPAPAIRAGNGRRDPYKTPTRTPTSASTATAMLRTGSTTVAPVSAARQHNPMGIDIWVNRDGEMQRPPARQATRSQSSETIDVLMQPPSFLQPPRAPGMRENRMTQDSSNTTFTKLMERAGFEGGDREEIRGWKT
jgi:hypothetical protein